MKIPRPPVPRRALVASTIVVLVAVAGACSQGEVTEAGQAIVDGEVGSGGADSATEGTTAGEATETDGVPSSLGFATGSTSGQTATGQPSSLPSSTVPGSSATEPTVVTTAPRPTVPVGLPTPEDVAQQYEALCLQTDNRDRAERWFAIGVLDDLGCRQGEPGDQPPPGAVTTFEECSEIDQAAGLVSHRCFFSYEGGGYSLLVGDPGNGYRGLDVLYVVD